MAALLYFEEKVHRKKVLRVDAIPLLFPSAFLRPMPEVASSAPPTTPRTPPVDTTNLGIPSPPEHAIPIPSEPTDPSQAPHLTEQTMPLEEPTTGEIEPSSPHDPPTTI
ncbi:hypothetical protein CK203_096218 [Vitis vinifera]|uniref:Uncharacterized protein n=1 Tax=Vitis vinifera TaxID=29760 RepID=A0A438EEU4_VITVI|nr:hypothetical protein CK203_096218 [Vitis vinifera]